MVARNKVVKNNRVGSRASRPAKAVRPTRRATGSVGLTLIGVVRRRAARPDRTMPECPVVLPHTPGDHAGVPCFRGPVRRRYPLLTPRKHESPRGLHAFAAAPTARRRGREAAKAWHTSYTACGDDGAAPHGKLRHYRPLPERSAVLPHTPGGHAEAPLGPLQRPDAIPRRPRLCGRCGNRRGRRRAWAVLPVRCRQSYQVYHAEWG
jgi:hypothetical protein